MKNLTWIYVMLFTSVISQNEWFPVGAKWHVNHHETGSILMPENCHSYEYFEVIKDTIIDGEQSKLISHKWVTCGGEELHYPTQIVKDKNQQVYYFKDGLFHLMYDFNLSVGDTLYLDENNWGCDSVGSLILDSISYLNIGNISLKQQHFSFFSYNEDEFNTINYIIVETIGRVLYGLEADFNNIAKIIFKPLGYCGGGPFGARPSKLRCYEDEHIQFKQELIYDYKTNQYLDLPCDTVVDLIVSTQKIKRNPLQISPNPASDHIRLALEEANNTIQIHNLQGQVVYQAQIADKNPTIHISTLAKGVYLLWVKDEQGGLFTGKLIKE